MTEMHKYFTDAEIVELGLAIGAFIMWGRLNYVFGVPQVGANYYTVLAAKDQVSK